jgi:hypothetical protein
MKSAMLNYDESGIRKKTGCPIEGQPVGGRKPNQLHANDQVLSNRMPVVHFTMALLYQQEA